MSNVNSRSIFGEHNTPPNALKVAKNAHSHLVSIWERGQTPILGPDQLEKKTRFARLTHIEACNAVMNLLRLMKDYPSPEIIGLRVQMRFRQTHEGSEASALFGIKNGQKHVLTTFGASNVKSPYFVFEILSITEYGGTKPLADGIETGPINPALWNLSWTDLIKGMWELAFGAAKDEAKKHTQSEQETHALITADHRKGVSSELVEITTPHGKIMFTLHGYGFFTPSNRNWPDIRANCYGEGFRAGEEYLDNVSNTFNSMKGFEEAMQYSIDNNLVNRVYGHIFLGHIKSENSEPW